MKKILFAALLIGLISCKKEKLHTDDHVTKEEEIEEETIENTEIITDTIVIADDLMAPTIKNGTFGYVIKKQGDFLAGTTTYDSVQYELYIYEKLTFKELKHAETPESAVFFYIDSVKYTPYAIITPNNKGFYEVELKPGTYTGLIKFDVKRFYNNLWGSNGHFGPITVKSDTLIQRDFIYDYLYQI